MTELDRYSIECHKHGMTYGEYEAAIRHGELPKPKMEKSHKVSAPRLTAEGSEKVYRKCKRCGGMFALPFPESQKRFCSDCLHEVLKEHGTKRRKIPDCIPCELCGAEFYRGRYPSGMAKGGKMCPTCYEKWVHMNSAQKHEFKCGERTLERLEAIRNGHKENC